MQYSTFTDIDFSDFCSFIFKVPIEKSVIHKEELRGIEIDVNPSRTVFIDKEYWNVKVVAHVGDLTRNSAIKKKPDVSEAYKCPL